MPSPPADNSNHQSPADDGDDLIPLEDQGDHNNHQTSGNESGSDGDTYDFLEDDDSLPKPNANNDDLPLDARQPTAVDEDGWDPILLEGEDVTECPSCGAPMEGGDEVVCLRCGFDLTRNQKIDTATGVHVIQADAEPPPPEHITSPGKGGMHLPAIMAGVAIILMTICYLAGVDGLYAAENASPTLGNRIGALVTFYLRTIVFALTTFAGLFIISRIEKRPIGDTLLALFRCVGIVAVCQIGLFVPELFGYPFLEFIFEFIIRGAIFVALVLFFFQMSVRDALSLGVVVMLIQLAIVAVTNTVRVIV